MLALPKSPSKMSKDKSELSLQLRNNKKKERQEQQQRRLLELPSKTNELTLSRLSNEKLELAVELEEKMREIHEQQRTMLNLQDKIYSNTRLTMSKEKYELSEKLEKNMSDLEDAQKKLLELHARSSEDARLTTALELQLEEKKIKLDASLKEREKLERELGKIKTEMNSISRQLDIERKERRDLEKTALDLIKNAKKKWELSEKEKLQRLNKHIETQTVRITELCTSNNEMSSKLQRLQCELETTTAELHKLRTFQIQYKESLAKTRELRRQSVAGVENKLEEIATRSHNQLAEIRMKLESEILKNNELENELRNEKDGNHCRISRMTVALELAQSDLKDVKEQLRSAQSMIPPRDEEINTLRNQLKELTKQLEDINNNNNKDDIVKNLENNINKLRQENEDMKIKLNKTNTNLNNTIINLKQSENIAFNLEKSVLDKVQLQEKLQESQEKEDDQLRKVEELEESLNNLQKCVTKLEIENAKLKNNNNDIINKKITSTLTSSSSSASETTTTAAASITTTQLLNDEKKSYEQQIQRLEKRVELSREKLNNEKDTLIKLKSELRQKEVELKSSNIDKRIAERNEKSLKDKIELLEKDKKELIEKLNIKQNEIDDKSKKILMELDKAKSSLADITKQSSRNRLQADSAQRALTQANEQIQQLQTSSTNLRRELDSSRKENQTNQERLISLKNDNKRFMNDITKLNELKNTLECKIIDLERKLKEVELNNEVLKETCVVLEEQLTDYERLTSDHETRENTLVQEKMRLQKDIDDIEKKLRESKTGQNEEKTKRLIAERKIEKLETDTLDIENEKDHLLQQNNEYKNKVQELSNQLSNLTMKLHDMECDLLHLERALEHAETDAIQVKEESSVYLTRLHQLKDNNEDLTNDLKSSIEQGQELRLRIAELESVLEEMRQFYSEHEFKNEGTRQQQTKLIDYLQLKLEEQSKKKKNFCDKIFKSKQKEQLPPLMQLNGCSMPVGYRELENQLSRERAKVKKLTEQLLDLKATIASTTPTSPNKKTTTTTSSTSLNSPKKYNNNNKNDENLQNKFIRHNSASIQRSGHNIHHKFNVEKLSFKSDKCSVCNETIQFGKQVSICSYCKLMTHCKCSSKAEANCGLPGGFIEHLKNNWRNSDESIATLTGSVQTLTIDEPDYTIFDDDNDDDNDNYSSNNDGDNNKKNKKINKNNNSNITMESWVKVTGNSKILWDRKYLRLEDGYLCVYEHEPLKNMSPINKINLTGKSGFSIRDTIDQTDIPGTAKSDLEFIFRVEEGSRPCWSSPPRLDIMALSQVDKKSWLNALKSITTSTSCLAKNTMSSTILRLEKNRLDLNCVVELEKEGVLLVCAQEGLYSFRPSHSKILTAIRGVKKVNKLSLHENIGLAIMIAGEDRKLVSCDLRQLKSNAMAADCSRPAITTKNILNGTESCHFYQLQNNLLCAATHSTIILLKWQTNDEYDEFIPIKEFETGEPCSCAIFTNDTLIVGCQKFYQINLNNYNAKDLPEDDGSSDKIALAGLGGIGSFPVAVLNVGNLNDGRIEILLCYSEFGVFVDEYGQRTRAVDPTWNHLPFSFAFRSPYLFIIHFATVEVIKLTPDVFNYKSKIPEKTLIDFNNPRYLGLAGSRGIYVSNSTSTLDIQKIDGAASIMSRMTDSVDSLCDNDESSSEWSFSQSLVEALDNPGKKVHFAESSNPRL